MSTGTWAAGVLVILVLNARRLAAQPAVAEALLDAQWAVFWMMVIALVILAITGGFYMRYWKERATPEELEQKTKLLWIKHALFLVVYGAGTVWMWLLIK